MEIKERQAEDVHGPAGSPADALRGLADPDRTRGADRDEALRHIEGALDDIRTALDAHLRERQHRDFSLARFAGAISQAVVIGILAWAASDCFFGIAGETILIKLGFAGVLQLVAMTAFVLAGRER